MTEAYDKALRAFERAEKAHVRAGAELAGRRQELEEARKTLPLKCQCGHEQAVGEIELIDEQSLEGDYDDVDTRHDYSYVCAGCQRELILPRKPPQFDSYNWPRKYFKVVHECQNWNGSREPARVTHLRAPGRLALAREKAERERAAGEAAALAVLKKAGYKIEAPK